MVFAGTCRGRIFGVTFIREILRSVPYQNIVKNTCIPQLKAMNGGSLRGITWQQDGANIHRNPAFMDYLENTFDGNVLALGADVRRRRGHSWSPRSPDLSTLDFALWPILKRRVFKAPRPQTIAELEARIVAEIDQLNREQDLINRCHISVRGRAQLCLQNFGGHFEFMRTGH